jgi:hypothetical protein
MVYRHIGLDDRAIGVRSLAGAKDFSCSLCGQTGSGAHPASCPMGTGGPSPGGKSAAGAWRWPLTPIQCRGREWGAIGPLPPSASMACSGTALYRHIPVYIPSDQSMPHSSEGACECLHLRRHSVQCCIVEYLYSCIACVTTQQGRVYDVRHWQSLVRRDIILST